MIKPCFAYISSNFYKHPPRVKMTFVCLYPLYEELYKYVFSDGNEYYANREDLKPIVKGVLKK